MEITEVVTASGHENIRATHRTTLEFTKARQLSRKGDCVIGVSADKALADLGIRFKDSLRREGAKLIFTVEAGGITEVVKSSGSPQLILAHSMDVVLRRSDYICARTLAICADKAACDLSRDLVNVLKDRNQKVKIGLIVEF